MSSAHGVTHDHPDARAVTRSITLLVPFFPGRYIGPSLEGRAVTKHSINQGFYPVPTETSGTLAMSFMASFQSHYAIFILASRPNAAHVHHLGIHLCDPSSLLQITIRVMYV